MTERSAHRVGRIVRGLGRPSTRARFLALARQRRDERFSRATRATCAVCGSPAAVPVTIADARTAHGAPAQAKRFRVHICRACGHVGNPENMLDYRTYDGLEELTEAGRIGTPDRQGREFHMAKMAIDILGRDDLEVLIFGAGRSFDNQHIAALPQVRHVAIADVMQLRDDAEFIDANLPAPRRFDGRRRQRGRRALPGSAGAISPICSTISSPTACSSAGRTCTTAACWRGRATSSSRATPRTTASARWHGSPRRTATCSTSASRWSRPVTAVRESDTCCSAGRRRSWRRPAATSAPGRYAPSESPTANRELAAAREARLAAERPVRPGG